MLVVFGDSHAHIWSGNLVSAETHRKVFPFVKVNYLGAALAYNLMGEGAELGKWGSEIVRHPDVTSTDTTAIMLCFGEIDCRTQVLKHALNKKLSIRQVCSEVSRRYLAFIDELLKITGVPVVIWGPIATTPAGQNWDEKYPNVGTETERNAATQELSRLLGAGAEERPDVFFASIIDKMMTPLGTTKQKYVDDGCHLNFEGLALAIDAFNEAKSKFSDSGIDYFESESLNCEDLPALRDISTQARIVDVSTSAQQARPQFITRQITGDIIQTKQETQPWVLVDIGFGALLDRVEVFRSGLDLTTDVLSIEVLGGLSRTQFETLYQHGGEQFGAQGMPLSFENPIADKPIRFLMFRLQRPGALRLAEIKLYARTFVE